MQRYLWHALLFTFTFLPQIANGQSAAQPHQLVAQAWQVVQQQYYDSTFNNVDWSRVRRKFLARDYRTKAEAYTAISNMLLRLNNPATRWLTQKEFTAMLAELSGNAIVGTGLLELLCLDIHEQTRKLTVVTPLPNSPAAFAGLQPGDEILKINGVATEGVSLAAAMRHLRDPRANKMNLTIQRASQSFEVEVSRGLLTSTQTVQASLREEKAGKIGYLALVQFTPTAGAEMREAINRLTQAGAAAFVLDLRYNPGGFLPACQDIAGMFLGEVKIANLISRSNDFSELQAQGERLTDKPLAVLVNAGTASAAEVLAGALQESRRAHIVGTRTFGKGLVHNAQQLADSSGLMITIARAQTVKGRDILTEGIMPDEIVAAPEELLKQPWPPAAAPAGDRPYHRAVEKLLQKKKLFIAIFSLGPAWQKDKPAHEQAHFKEHSANLQRLRAEKKILLGARYADKGMIILSAADEPEARAWLESDPMVVNSVFTLALHPFQPFYYGSIEKE